MKVTEHEMRGLLTGKCVPADMLVNEELPAYLVRKFAALQQKLDAVLAENAKLMSGFSFFMYSDESGFETYKTEAEAIAAANEMIGCCREDAASDGWPEETETIRWGVIRQQAVECDYQKASEENGWMGWCDYKLSPETPATDAILNEVRAEGVDRFGEFLAEPIDGESRFKHVCGLASHFAETLRAGNVEGETPTASTA